MPEASETLVWNDAHAACRAALTNEHDATIRQHEYGQQQRERAETAERERDHLAVAFYEQTETVKAMTQLDTRVHAAEAYAERLATALRHVRSHLYGETCPDYHAGLNDGRNPTLTLLDVIEPALAADAPADVPPAAHSAKSDAAGA